MNGIKTVVIDEINSPEIILDDHLDVMGQPFHYKLSEVHIDGSISYSYYMTENDQLMLLPSINTISITELKRCSKYENLTYDPENKVYKCSAIRKWDNLTDEEKLLILRSETKKFVS